MNKTLSIVFAIALLTACTNTPTSTQTIDTPTNVGTSALPVYEIDTNQFKQTGVSTPLQDAAIQAADGGRTYFAAPELLNVQVDDFAMGFMQVRVDAHNFIVGQRVDTIWRFEPQSSDESILRTVRSLTQCRSDDQINWITGYGRAVYSVVTLDC